ncbi:hypothetical protein HK405_001220 [Cladochytrium tenue]|nr:hypothetical protein HK405_001220 [Cladochytrium tenue]
MPRDASIEAQKVIDRLGGSGFSASDLVTASCAVARRTAAAGRHLLALAILHAAETQIPGDDQPAVDSSTSLLLRTRLYNAHLAVLGAPDPSNPLPVSVDEPAAVRAAAAAAATRFAAARPRPPNLQAIVTAVAPLARDPEAATAFFPWAAALLSAPVPPRAAAAVAAALAAEGHTRSAWAALKRAVPAASGRPTTDASLHEPVAAAAAAAGDIGFTLRVLSRARSLAAGPVASTPSESTGSTARLESPADRAMAAIAERVAVAALAASPDAAVAVLNSLPPLWLRAGFRPDGLAALARGLAEDVRHLPRALECLDLLRTREASRRAAALLGTRPTASTATAAADTPRRIDRPLDRLLAGACDRVLALAARRASLPNFLTAYARVVTQGGHRPAPAIYTAAATRFLRRKPDAIRAVLADVTRLGVQVDAPLRACLTAQHLRASRPRHALAAVVASGTSAATDAPSSTGNAAAPSPPATAAIAAALVRGGALDAALDLVAASPAAGIRPDPYAVATVARAALRTGNVRAAAAALASAAAAAVPPPPPVVRAVAEAATTAAATDTSVGPAPAVALAALCLRLLLAHPQPAPRTAAPLPPPQPLPINRLNSAAVRLLAAIPPDPAPTTSASAASPPPLKHAGGTRAEKSPAAPVPKPRQESLRRVRAHLATYRPDLLPRLEHLLLDDALPGSLI